MTKPKFNNQTPLIAIVGASGVGKTTYMEKLIPELAARGLKIGTIKHDVHGFEMDKPGKDSWRHKKAGAFTTIISSPDQIGMVADVDHDHTPGELARFFPGADLIIAEGYKHGNLPKLEVFRTEISDTLLCKSDDSLMAVITDSPIKLNVPLFAVEDIRGAADYLIKRFCPG